MAETLALAGIRRRKVSSWRNSLLIWVLEGFFMEVTLFFVDIPWVRFTFLFLTLPCGSAASRLAKSLLYPETIHKGRSWKYHLKTLFACMSLWKVRKYVENMPDGS